MQLAILAIAIGLFGAGGGLAAPACKDAGSATAKPVFYYTADAAVLDGLAVALDLGLEPAEFPAREIARNRNACTRSSFTAGGGAWTLYGADADAPPRWARSPDSKTIIYLAAMPPADLAHAWAEAQRRHKTDSETVSFKGMMFALVETSGDDRRVFGFYDALPDDRRLSAAMQAVIEGRRPPVLGFNVKTRDLDEARMVEPLTLMVLGSQGKITPTDTVDPDGVAFSATSDGAARARSSALGCPAAVGGLRRSALFTTGETDGGQEAGCRYVGERARMTIVATRIVDGVRLEDAMASIIAPPASQSKGQPTSAPTLAADVPAGLMSANFQGADGWRTAIWAYPRGGWFVELYVLYGMGDEAEAGSAASAQVWAKKAP
jgi:hypothetical protein